MTGQNGAHGGLESGGGEAPEALAYLFAEGGNAPTQLPALLAVGGDVLTEREMIRTAEGTVGPASVRAVVAGKLSRLLPHLSRDRRERVRDLTLRALEQLARDEALLVREALASAIKDVACAPPTVCLALAQDIERSVAEPILHYCATLGDDDLEAIITGRPPSWALSAIARRKAVSPRVATALCNAGDETATGLLLDNQGAEIPEPTLSDVVEEARQMSQWQERLARRPQLPVRLALRMAEFVDHAALEILRGRKDFDTVTAKEVVRVARRRIQWLQDTEPSESPSHRVNRLQRGGKLDEAAVEDALSWKQVDFVRAALAARAQVTPAVVDKVLAARSGRAVMALAWRAGLGVRLAMQLQRDVARIPPAQVVNARGGTEYPMAPAEMNWQLEFFGVATDG